MIEQTTRELAVMKRIKRAKETAQGISPNKTPRAATSAGAAYSLPFPVASTGLGRRTGQRAMRALRRPRHRRGPVARSTWPRRRRTTRHQTTRRLRRVFEQERRPFMLAIKELRPPAAACARSDRRQSREVRAVGRGRAQCDGLSEDGCAPAPARA